MRRTGIRSRTPRLISSAPVEPCVSSSSGTPNSMTSLLAAECRNLLLVQLQRSQMPEHGRIEIGVEHERTDFGPSNERLPVEREPAVARERGEHVRREVGARQAADLNPFGPSDRASVLERPGRARVADRHLPLLAVVADLEGRRARRGQPRPLHAERGQRRDESATIGFGRARDDARAAAEEPQRPGGVIRGAADARPPARDRVQRDVPDDRDAAHCAHSRTGASRASPPPARARPRRRSSGALRRCPGPAPSPSASVHQDGPTGRSHW